MAANETAALLAPEQLGMFLRAHPDRILVCHGAARLHWLLHDHLKDSADRAILWSYSRECRLIDVQILDEQVRRYEGVDSDASSLADLAMRYTQIVMPADSVVEARVAAALPTLLTAPDPELLGLVGRTAEELVAVYGKLQAEAERIRGEVEDSCSPPPTSAPSREMQEQATAAEELLRAFWAEKRRAAARSADTEQDHVDRAEKPPRQHYGVLGSGIDAQGAIAVHQLARQGPVLTHERCRKVVEEGERLYGEACARLSGDHDGRGCFKWDKRLIVRDPTGQPIYDGEKLTAWLAKVADRFIDWHGFPAVLPRDASGTLAPDPERWGHWADCDRGLAAYRDLLRAAAMMRMTTETEWPIYQATPRLSCLRPTTDTVRRCIGPLFHAREGHVFLVGTLLQLGLRCFAAICRRSGYSGNGRLYGYLLHDEDPVELIAAELYARSAKNTGVDLEDAIHGFRTGPQIPEAIRHDWLRLTGALLASLPLGLPLPLLRVYLDGVHGIAVAEKHLEVLVHLLADQVMYELKGHMDLSIDRSVARHVGRPMGAVLQALWEPLHSETMQAALRNDLLGRRPRRSLLARPVWQLLQPDGPPGDVARRIITRGAITLAERVAPPAYPAAIRLAEYLHAMDEVMKAVAYALVDAGYRLVGLGDNDFVVEIPASDAEEEVARIGVLAMQNAGRLLSPLPTPCLVQQVGDW